MHRKSEGHSAIRPRRGGSSAGGAWGVRAPKGFGAGEKGMPELIVAAGKVFAVAKLDLADFLLEFFLQGLSLFG